MIRRPPRSTHCISSAASDVYKRQVVDVDEKKSAELAIIENIQRENLNIFEQASSIASLIDIYNLTQEDAARQLSMSLSLIHI